MKASLPTDKSDDAGVYAMNDLSKSEVELVELSRKLAEHRQAALVQEAQDRRDEQLACQPAHASPVPRLPRRRGPFFCLADLTIGEVSLINCHRADRAPVEIWAELARLQCEEISEGSATL